MMCAKSGGNVLLLDRVIGLAPGPGRKLGSLVPRPFLEPKRTLGLWLVVQKQASGCSSSCPLGEVLPMCLFH
jgi:hypothetical protein